LDIHPTHDGVSLKVKPHFGYVEAIKASLRQRPDWIMVSEVRSLEVMHLIESATTGTHIMSTIHAENASTIPRRMLAMANLDAGSAPILYQNIHEILDLGIRVEAKQTKNGIERFVAEIVGFDVVDNQVVSQVLYRVGDNKVRCDLLKFQKGKGGEGS
ncbi:MAG: ATPase, T2SS/T4P/T4SS family, partial [Erysipelotrichaceae bacterium]